MARASFLRMMTHTCDIERFTASDTDDYNVPTGAWANVAVSVPCLIQQRRGLASTGRRDTIMDSTVVFQNVMFVPWGTNVREGDRVTNVKYKGTTTDVRKDSGGNAVTYTVVEAIDASGQKHHLEVKLKVADT